MIIYHELQHLNMCLDTVTDMNETLNTVTVYNFDAAIDLGHGFCPPPTSPQLLLGVLGN